MSNFLNKYLENIEKTKSKALADAIRRTTDDIVPQYISNFSYREHVVSLLFGDVQSGKTSHMFGLMCAAADAGFPTFILLTTDNVILQQQTLSRAQKDLGDFCVCDETDYLKFLKNSMEKPCVIVLKKNGAVLKQWKNNLATTKFCIGNPLFIVDDEADAASLNTKVNSNKISTINKVLDEIKHTSSCSIYLQVTGTPQAILLQTQKSGWKPYFVYYFRPGIGYVGGNEIFTDLNKIVVLTDDEEVANIHEEDEYPENGLLKAILSHLVVSAQIFLSGGSVCNFLVHPSVKKHEHRFFAEKIGAYLNEISGLCYDTAMKDSFTQVYNDLLKTKSDLLPFNQIYDFICSALQDNDLIKVLTLNSDMPVSENTQYTEGINIIVGGNTLGRGVTFPCLQTIYYCRIVKNPQADTMWQHARMFGYDRDPALMRIYMPPRLYKLFSDINATNNNLISQIQQSKDIADIKIVYSDGLRPTRKNVLDNKEVVMFSGGVNYFPFSPSNKSLEVIDELLEKFNDKEEYAVNLQLVIKILEQIESDNDWPVESFIAFLKSLVVENPMTQAKLIVRRNRDVAKGTGTLLSENDRKLGEKYHDVTVLTMYRLTGTKGWGNKPIWVPNIKLPEKRIYYTVNH